MSDWQRLFKHPYVPHIAGLLFVILTVFAVQQYREINRLETTLQRTQSTLSQTEEELGTAWQTIQNLEHSLSSTTEELTETQVELSGTIADKTNLAENLKSEKDRNDAFEEQIEEISGTVGILDKLSKTDEELLQKYSRVYFLNENYIPESLAEIDVTYQYNESRTMFTHSKVEPYLTEMLEDALADDINLWIVSAYRSFETQAQIKSNYLVQYGEGANAFSADQGYSEHQLGTTIDFTTNGLGGGLRGFETTEAYEWLLKHAHKYGFVLSYPEGNTFYEYEPWHWRFVGEDLAEYMHEEDIHFYDIDQREIDEYLVSIFD